MVTEILYKENEKSEPVHIGYFRNAPKDALRELYRNHNIYQYKNILAPTDSRLESRVSGLIIREAQLPVKAQLMDITDRWFRESMKEETEECVYYTAIQDAIDHYCFVPPSNLRVTMSYLDTRDWQEDSARENVLEDIFEIMSVTLKASDLSVKNLKFVAEYA